MALGTIVSGFAQSPNPVKTCSLATSVQYRQYAFRDPANQPIKAYVLTVDLRDPNTFIRPVGGTGCKKVSQHAAEANALAAVNGGFFDGNCKSVSFLKLDAVLKAFNSKNRSVLGIDGQERLSIKRVPAGRDWPEMRHAIGGIPRIVTDGRVDVNSEGASQSFITGRHPRTAVGLVDEQHAIIVMVDGRSGDSKGMSLKALAQFMISLGAKQAVNLDGGGSSALWVDPTLGDADGLINRPSDGRERRVNSALAVYAPSSGISCF